MGLANINGRMGPGIREILLRASDTVMGSGPIDIHCRSTQKAYHLRKNINQTLNKHQIMYSNSSMIHIKDNIRTTRKMDSVYTDGRTEQSIKDSF